MKHSKILLSIILTLALTVNMLAISPAEVEAATIDENGSVTVSTLSGIKKYMTDPAVKKITFSTSKTKKFTIPETAGSEDVELVIKGSNSNITNKAKWKSITLTKAVFFTEGASGNAITDNASGAKIVIGKNAKVLSLTVKANADITIKSKGKVESFSLSKKNIAVTVDTAAATTIKATTANMKLTLKGAGKITVDAASGATGTAYTLYNPATINVVKCNGDHYGMKDGSDGATVKITEKKSAYTYDGGHELKIYEGDKLAVDIKGNTPATPVPGTPTPIPTPVPSKNDVTLVKAIVEYAGQEINVKVHGAIGTYTVHSTKKDAITYTVKSIEPKSVNYSNLDSKHKSRSGIVLNCHCDSIVFAGKNTSAVPSTVDDVATDSLTGKKLNFQIINTDGVYLTAGSTTGLKAGDDFTIRIDSYEHKEISIHSIDVSDVKAYVSPTPKPTATPTPELVKKPVTPTPTPIFDINYVIEHRSYEGFNDRSKAVLDKSFEIVDQIITDGMSDEEKARAIHDYLIVNTEYWPGKVSEAPSWCYAAEGALINGICVCAGYAKAFYLLAIESGLECMIADSDKSNHAWNTVKIDGIWYDVDCTGDDQGEKPSYEGFLYDRTRTYVDYPDMRVYVTYPSDTVYIDYRKTSTKYTPRWWIYDILIMD